MASPDLSPWNPLIAFDLDPQDYVQRAVDMRGGVDPTYNPHTGDPDMELIEQMAVMLAEYGYAGNRTPDGVALVFAQFSGVPRKEGTPARGKVRFTTNTTAGGIDIPLGTVLSIDLEDGSTLVFTTDAAVVTAAGSATVIADMTATDIGSVGNNIPAGTLLAIQNNLVNVDSAAISTETAGGSDPEDDYDWLARFGNFQRRSHRTLVQADEFAEEALDWPTVYRSHAVDNYDGTTAGVGGHTSVAVLTEGGGSLLEADRVALQAHLQSKSVAILTIHVINPTIVTVNVEVSVRARPGFTQAEVESDVRAALLTYLSADTWEWGNTVQRYEVAARIDTAPSVDYVDTLTTPAANVPIVGAAPLAKLGTLTVHLV